MDMTASMIGHNTLVEQVGVYVCAFVYGSCVRVLVDAGACMRVCIDVCLCTWVRDSACLCLCCLTLARFCQFYDTESETNPDRKTNPNSKPKTDPNLINILLHKLLLGVYNRTSNPNCSITGIQIIINSFPVD